MGREDRVLAVVHYLRPAHPLVEVAKSTEVARLFCDVVDVGAGFEPVDGVPVEQVLGEQRCARAPWPRPRGAARCRG